MASSLMEGEGEIAGDDPDWGGEQISEPCEGEKKKGKVFLLDGGGKKEQAETIKDRTQSWGQSRITSPEGELFHREMEKKKESIFSAITQFRRKRSPLSESHFPEEEKSS